MGLWTPGWFPAANFHSEGKFVVGSLMPNKRTVQELKAAGICYSCRRRPAAPDRVLCEVCLAYRATARENYRSRGVCTGCGGPRDANGVRCSACKLRQLAAKFGVSEEGCRALFEASDYKCMVCRTSEVLVIDHDHESGAVRGVLCKQCNIALGGARDRIEVLEGLIRYLKAPPAKALLSSDILQQTKCGPRPKHRRGRADGV